MSRNTTRTTCIAALTMLAGAAAAQTQQAGNQVQGRDGMRPVPVNIDAGQPTAGERLQALFAEQRAFDVKSELPPHPPLHEIPPMPMPEGVSDDEMVHHVSFSNGAVFYDALTGETMELGEAGPSGAIGGQSIEGQYLGVAPEDRLQELSRGFGNMSLAGGLDTFPRSGNVKLAMRFTDQAGNTRWFSCSGTMADSGVVLTAAHCIYARSPNGIDIFDWADIVYVYPAWDGDGSIFGPATDAEFNNFGMAYGTSYIAGSGYVNDGDWDRDAGVVRITRGGSRSVGMLTGWYAWAWGGSCGSIQSRTYNNFSYPAENCPTAGLHNGQDMYYWNGTVDSCPGNQMQLSTGGNCLDTVWGGMSGSGMYYIDGDNRYVHGICSTSNRNDVGRYCKMWEQFTTDMVAFENTTRGTAEDWEPLMFRARGSTTVQAGTSMNDSCDVRMVNATNANPPARDYTLRVYLSSNNNISTSDTQIATWIWGNRDFGAMANVNFVVPAPTIPIDTPPGTYYVGVIADSGLPGTTSNDDTDTWDAQRITVTVGLPASASGPVPSNNSTSQQITANLDWGTAARATAYRVYFGTDATPDAGEYQGQFSSSSLNLPNLAYNTTYYWRVDTVNSAGTITGPTWNFTTRPVPLPDMDAELANAPSGTFYPGEFVSVTHRTRNVGEASSSGLGVNFRLSTNNIISVGDFDMGNRNFSGLGVGSFLQTSSSVQIPLNAPAGNYYVGTIVSEPGNNEPTFANNWVADTNTITVGECVADFASPYGSLNFFDVSAFIGAYNLGDSRADLAAPFGTLNFFDISAFIAAYNAGCP